MLRKHKHTSIIIYFFIVVLHVTVYAQNVTHDKVFDEGFKERYSGDRYDYTGKKIIKPSAYGSGNYADYKNSDKPKIEEEEEEEDSVTTFSLDGISWLLISIMVIAVVYLVYILLNEGSGSWFRTTKNKKLINNEHENIDMTNATEDEFLSLIKKAENDNDYRLAIRYYFLYVLKAMNLKKLIKIEEDKTNSEYLNEIKNEKVSQHFHKILYLYNYTWYGEFRLSKFQYNTAKSNFNHFIKKIGL